MTQQIDTDRNHPEKEAKMYYKLKAKYARRNSPEQFLDYLDCKQMFYGFVVLHVIVLVI